MNIKNDFKKMFFIEVLKYHTLKTLVFNPTSSLTLLIFVSEVGFFDAYFLNSLRFKIIFNFFTISVKAMSPFKKSLTSSSLADVITVS